MQPARLLIPLMIVCLPATVLADETVDIDVSRVALFSSGVGYFECATTVDGAATAELRFRTEQINDILKSMVVQDLDGGRVGAIGYASQDPIAKTLRSFGVDLTDDPTLGELLHQLRGEPVEIAGPRTITGTIVGVEKSPRYNKDEETIEVVELLTVLTETGLERLDMSTLRGIRLTNDKVAAELHKALATLAGAHNADKKSVSINFEGSGQRRVRVAYLLEAPIWKTSYRLVLNDDQEPFLQGWATVENATEEDWNDVRLSLVSGRPISFRMDLYTPLYVPRPMEQLERYASLRPPSFEGGFAERRVAEQPPVAGAPIVRRGERGRAGGRTGTPSVGDIAALESVGYAGKAVGDAAAGNTWYYTDLEGAGVESVATALEAGELFAYHIDDPVSIPRQHSALLPIVNQEVEGEKVSIYNPRYHAKHPLNGLELKNATELNLMQGPVTVFDSGIYAGDAKLPDLKPDEKRLVAYALDLSTEVLVKQQPRPDQIVSLRIVKGTLWHKHKYVDERTYQIKNKIAKKRTVVLEQAYADSWTLIEPAEPYERTQDLLRFKVDVPGQETTAHKVVLERVTDQSVSLGNLGLDQIRFYLRSRVISSAVAEALERVIALRTELDEIERLRKRVEKEHAEATKEQERIRKNLQTLDRNTDAYQRQLRLFDELETRIGKLSGSISEQRDAAERKRRELERYLLSLNVE